MSKPKRWKPRFEITVVHGEGASLFHVVDHTMDCTRETFHDRWQAQYALEILELKAELLAASQDGSLHPSERDAALADLRGDIARRRTAWRDRLEDEQAEREGRRW